MGDASLGSDLASALVTDRSASIDVARKRALALSSFGPTHAEQCKLAALLNSRPQMQRALGREGKLFTYFEPGSFAFSSTPVAMKDLPSGRVFDCASLQCEAERPVCYFKDGPETDVFVIDRGVSGLSLVAAAFYNGS
jgi:hypothetical protein